MAVIVAIAVKTASPPFVAAPVEVSARLDITLDIVIVEDNVDTADALGLYYRVCGHTVRIAYRAQDALAMMLSKQPDVVISDIGLPNTDGYELLQKLVEINSMSRTAFIAVTGYASEADRERAFKAGFDAHFAKPVDLKALDAVLARLTQAKQKHRFPANRSSD